MKSNGGDVDWYCNVVGGVGVFWFVFWGFNVWVIGVGV